MKDEAMLALAKEFAKNLKTEADLNNFSKALKKLTVETILNAELTDHLGYEKHSPRVGKNARNGYTTKRLLTDDGEFELDTPRDRDGTFEPQFIKKSQTRITQMDSQILSLYAKGMTTRDIVATFKEMYDADVSATLISKVTDAVIDQVTQWQNRPLDAFYPIVYLDCIVVKVRHNNTVINKAVFLALGVNAEGQKDLLGLWMAENEGAKFWLSVLTELKNRGVQDILIACTDNLKGFSEAISSTFPETVVQSCIVHQVRNTLKYVVCKDYKAITADMRAIYSSPTLEAAEGELTRFTERWEKKYPTAVRSWQENWYKLSSFFDFGKEIRRLMYTTNPIEGIHRRMRKVTKTKGCFPSDMAIKKLVYLVIRDINASPKAEVKGWKLIYGQLCIKFAERMAKFGA